MKINILSRNKKHHWRNIDAFLSDKISEENNVKYSPKYKTHLVLKMHIVRRGGQGCMVMNFKVTNFGKRA